MSNILLVGLILLLALAGGHLVKLLKVPEIVGYFFIGLFLGPSFTAILTHDTVIAMEVFSQIALGLILFSIGAIFEFGNLRKVGMRTLWLTLFIMGGTIVTVIVTLLLCGQNWQTALLLGVIATEISPIATILVLRELNSEGPLTDSITNLLALNNVGCLVVFGVAAFLVRLLGGGPESASFVGFALRETFHLLWGLLGSVALGVVLGYLLATWGGKVEEQGEVLILVLGMILIAVGATQWLGLSALITTMTLGATLINLSKESQHLFDVLGSTDPPLYAIFFVLAGAHLKLSSLAAIGLSGIGYTVARVLGKTAGAYLGAGRLGFPETVKKYLGFSLVPHAGVAIGLALQMRSILPAYAETIATVVLGSVLINEVAGPVITKLAIGKAGEIRLDHAEPFERV
ncbi:MAG: cation:proton antiporter [Blastocatellia bacterium]|nr:cation:proton antiporter [Blastocatellia bacterium]